MAGRRRRWVKVLCGFGAVAVLGGSFTAYQITHRRAPSFRRGGVFVDGRAASAAPVNDAAPLARHDAVGVSAVSAASGPATSTTITPVASAVRAAPTTTTTGRAAMPALATASTSTTRPAAAVAPGTSAAVPGRPAVGTYIYAVDGEEVASVFGTRRFPERMTLTLHGAPDLSPDQLTADTRYSEVHEEREIVGFRGGAVYSDFQGGSISYGPVTQTAEGDLDPPSLTIPETLAPGVTRSGVSFYKDSHGTVTNTLDWTVAVIAQETLDAAGASLSTWRIEIHVRTRPGASDQVDRQRTVWYDPQRAWWVRYTDKTRASRKTLAGTLTYDAHLTATMTGFTPA